MYTLEPFLILFQVLWLWKNNLHVSDKLVFVTSLLEQKRIANEFIQIFLRFYCKDETKFKLLINLNLVRSSHLNVLFIHQIIWMMNECVYMCEIIEPLFLK